MNNICLCLLHIKLTIRVIYLLIYIVLHIYIGTSDAEIIAKSYYILKDHQLLWTDNRQITLLIMRGIINDGKRAREAYGTDDLDET